VRVLYFLLAGVFFGLAVLGAVLPVLPTTPFLILTSWSLVRASPRLEAKLRRSPFFGPLLEDWRRHRGLRPQVKVTAIGTVVLVVTLSLVFAGLPWWGGWALVALAVAGIVVIASLRTVRDDPPPRP
jgi:uncharacterized membrane protein YbaN (DUF454 family)